MDVVCCIDLCPANCRILHRRYPDVRVIEGDINLFEQWRHHVPLDIDLVTVAMQCQPSSSLNVDRSPDDPRHDTNYNMLMSAIKLNTHCIIIENVFGFADNCPEQCSRTLDTLRAMGYYPKLYRINSKCWTASSRPRIYIIGMRGGGTDAIDKVADYARTATPKVLSDVLVNLHALWHRPFANSVYEDGAPCMIGPNDTYPCVTTKVFTRMPRSYKARVRDVDVPYELCTKPTPQIILRLLGFPSDYLTEDEIHASKCTCPVCYRNRAPQVGRQLGRIWCPAAAREILLAVKPDLMAVRDCARETRYDRPLPAPNSSLVQMATYNHDLAAEEFFGVSELKCQQFLARANATAQGTPSRVNLSESVCQQYVRKHEEKTKLDIRTLAPPEYYNASQIKIHESVSAEHRARIHSIHAKYKEAFLKNSNDLPPTVLDDDLRTPLKVAYRLVAGWKPVRVPRPKMRPGSAKYKIYEQVRIDYEAKGLIVHNPTSRWAARPHLVAKYAEDAARTGIPDSIRFTGDFVSTNKMIDMIAATHGHVPTELDRASGKRFYIKLDAAHAYWQFALDELSSEVSTIWLPCNGQWKLYSMTRLVMGCKNAGTIMQNYYYHCCEKALTRAHFSNLADDFVLFADDIDVLLDEYERFLALFIRRRARVKPPKVFVCYPYVEYYGWKIDIDGLSPAERNIKPFRNMIAPKNMDELAHIIGLFVGFARFIVKEKLDPSTNEIRPYFYKELIKPISIKYMRDQSRGKSFAERWGPEQDATLDEIRQLLIQGVHLFTPLADRPFHMTTDMSLYGYGAYLYQLADDGSKRTVSHFNGVWSRSERFMPPVYKEASAWARGFEGFFSIVRSFGQPFYTFTDSTPVGWQRKGNGRRAMSAFRLANFDEVEWEVFYLEGSRNTEADSLSRPPMLGELDPSVPGMLAMLEEALKCLPHKQYRRIFINGDDDAQAVANYIRDWREIKGRGKIELGSYLRLSPQLKPDWSKAKPAEYDLAIALPPVEFGPAVCGDLLRAGKPFICLVESQLLCRVHQRMDFSYDDEVRKLMDTQTSRRSFPAMGYTLIIGGLGNAATTTYDHRQFQSRSLPASTVDPVWSQYHCDEPRLSALCHTAYLSRCFSAPSHSITLPGLGGKPPEGLGSVASWQTAQQREQRKLAPADKKLMRTRADGVLMYHKDDDGRCFVPSDKRRPLVLTTHERMFHLGALKVYSHLKRYYWWPVMRQTIIDILAPCKECQLTKGKQYRAHKMWRSVPLAMPRSAWGFDFKGVESSDPIHNTVHREIALAIDHASHRLVLFAAPNRQASTTAHGILDNVINKFGVPLQWRTDSAAELLGNVMTRFWKPYGTNVTDTKAYHAEGNALAERAMAYVNICLRLLSDEQYRFWPHYISSMEAAWNNTTVRTVEATPFEIDCGTPMRTPEDIIASGPALPPAVKGGKGKKTTPTTAEVLHTVQQSAAAWAHVSQRVSAWHKHQTAERLNARGHKRDFKLGDTVSIYMPPTADEARRRKRKAKHLDWFRGPCVITKKSGDAYTVKHNDTGRVYERTIQNVSPYKCRKPVAAAADEDALVKNIKKECKSPNKVAATSTPTAERCPADTSVFAVGELIAAKDTPTHDVWWLHEVLSITDNRITTRIYGTASPKLSLARFRPCWVDKRSNKIQFMRPPSNSSNVTPWTQVFLATELPASVLARKLSLKHGETTEGKLTARTLNLLKKLPGSTCHATVGKNTSAIL